MALAALAALFSAPLLAAPAAQGAEARYDGAPADGSVAFFSTTDKLVPGDTDIQRDVYVRSVDAAAEGVTRQVSLGPTGGNNSFPAEYQGSSEAGDKVFFSTGERLTAADKDNATDIYVRDLTENKTTLVTAGDPSCAGSQCGEGNVPADAVPGGVVADGGEVFFVSGERLSSQDADGAADIYVRNLEEGTTTLVSAAAAGCEGGCGSGSGSLVFQGASAGGAKAIFTTTEGLVSGDEDGKSDLYERDLSGEETYLVSVSGECPSAPCPPSNSSISRNGAHVFFETKDRIAGEDEDESQDVYDWSGGAPVLASTAAGSGNDAHDARFLDSSADGGEVFFATDEQLDEAEDSDSAEDVYVRLAGTATELVSAGDGSCGAIEFCEKAPSLPWVAADGSTVVLSTKEPLLAADEDKSVDVYERALPGGPTKLVSRAGPSCEADPECGNQERDAQFAGASTDGARLFFITDEALAPIDPEEPLVPGDADEQKDVYERHAETTKLVSAGQFLGEGIHSGNGPFDAQLQAVSADGTRAFLTTDEQLTGEDFDSTKDIYARLPTGTLLVSRGNDSKVEEELAPPPPVLERTDPESPGVSTEPDVIGSEEEGVEGAAPVKLYTTADCSGEPIATGTVEGLEEGISVSVESGSTTQFTATTEAEGFVSACSAPPLVYKQEASSPPGEEPGGGGGGGSGGSGGGEGDSSAAPAPAPVPAPAPGKTHDGIAYLTPATRITFGPAFKTRARRPVFRFTDSTGQPGTRFRCRVDRRRWKSCNSPTRLKHLRRGRHVFRVRAINAVGVREAKPRKRAFKLVRR